MTEVFFPWPNGRIDLRTACIYILSWHDDTRVPTRHTSNGATLRTNYTVILQNDDRPAVDSAGDTTYFPI